jgi:putative transposase
MTGRASRLFQKEFPELSGRYRGKPLWGLGYGGWSTGNITEEIVQEYLKRHKNSANDTEDFKLD